MRAGGGDGQTRGESLGRKPLQFGNELTKEVNRKQLEDLRPEMEDLEVRLADMDVMRVDVQSLSVSPYQLSTGSRASWGCGRSGSSTTIWPNWCGLAPTDSWVSGQSR